LLESIAREEDDEEEEEAKTWRLFSKISGRQKGRVIIEGRQLCNRVCVEHTRQSRNKKFADRER
jgi:hypothetical protein